MARSQWEKVFWTLAGVGAIYAIAIGSMIDPWVQRQALYAHNINTLRFQDIDKPETFGFAPGQVTPFRIKKTDGDSLYAWHVMPLGAYSDHEEQAIEQMRARTLEQNFDLTELSKKLLKDQESRLVINFHGNAGHVAQGQRVPSLKAIPTADHISRTHVVTFDYRGFGKSDGEPTEQGLIEDGLAVIDWAINQIHVDPSRIVLLGHSLGTAVATATAERHVDMSRTGHEGPMPFPFAGLLLSGGFTDVPELLKTYAISGIFPVLSPLQGYPRLQKYLTDSVVDRWNTSHRLQSLASSCDDFRLHIMHSINDFDIRSHHADLLFDAAVAGIGATRLSYLVNEYKSGPTRVRSLYGFKDGVDVLKGKHITRSLLQYGSHNRALTFAEVSIAVRRLFELADAQAMPRLAES